MAKDKTARKRRGSAPNHDSQPMPPHDGVSTDVGYPVLCLRHTQSGWGISELDPGKCKEFLEKWEKRSKLTWTELVQHNRHGLGSEQLNKDKFKPQIPERLERDRYMVFRHEGNLPFAGFRTGDVFHVMWIECKFGDLYDHG